ncbi:MAG: thiolase family protein [Proteobacteria bacterium]|nr:MAG: thiolase family protein [Pseudomonadota bacterium]
MANLRDVVIVDGVRTPFVKAGADFAKIRAHELGRVAMRELVERLELGDGLGPKARVKVDEVCVGNVGSPEDAANIARVVGMQAGLAKEIGAYSVHRNCASGMEAIMQGWIKIASGQADVMLVGGVESMSNMPLIYRPEAVAFFGMLMKAKTPIQKIMTLMKMPLGAFLNPIVAIQEGLTDPFCGMNMGQTADLLAKEFRISREEQDKYALESHRRAVAAQENGKLAEEIIPVGLPTSYKQLVKQDVGPRKGQTMEQLAKLKPYFDRVNGTVTVGNACPITDGAVMMALMSEEKAREAGYQILGKIRSIAFTGHEPERMGLGPVYSSHKALQKAGLSLKQMDVIEINEAFSAQAIAVTKAAASREWCQEKLGTSEALGEIDPAKMNPNGGAVALGHPVGASGARVVLTAMKELKRSGKQFGLATLCIGGGQGGACVVERV